MVYDTDAKCSLNGLSFLTLIDVTVPSRSKANNSSVSTKYIFSNIILDYGFNMLLGLWFKPIVSHSPLNSILNS